MFTGIVEERGAVLETSGRRLVVSCRTVAEGSEVGSSIAVNGVCLTVVEGGEGTLAFDVTEETLARSALGRLRPGHPVNLERPVTLLTRLGGHLVQGHVDGVGVVASLDLDDGGATMRVHAPAEVSRYLVEKGSVAVDGVSLTVAGIDPGGESFSIALIPHTLDVTTLGSARPGEPVNLEVDVIAKHVERLLERSGR
jgi:riboflavin synthase